MMRLKSLLLSALAGLSVIASSCSKDSTTAPTTPAPVAGMSFKTSATTYSFTPMTAAEAATNKAVLNKAYFSSNANTDTVSLIAYNLIGTDTMAMVLRIPLLPTKTGTYSLNSTLTARNLLTMYYLNIPKAVAEINANQQAVRSWTTNGTLTLTKVDMVAKKITGTYVFNQNFGNNLSISLSEGVITDLPFIIE